MMHDASAPPKLPNPKANAESTRIAVQYFGSPAHVKQLRRRRAVKIRVPVSCIPFCQFSIANRIMRFLALLRISLDWKRPQTKNGIKKNKNFS